MGQADMITDCYLSYLKGPLVCETRRQAWGLKGRCECVCRCPPERVLSLNCELPCREYMREAWPNSRDVSRSVAFTNNTVAPDTERERWEDVNKPPHNKCVRQTAVRREKTKRSDRQAKREGWSSDRMWFVSVQCCALMETGISGSSGCVQYPWHTQAHNRANLNSLWWLKTSLLCGIKAPSK